MDIVVIGGGVAGYEAALAASAVPGVRCTLCSAEAVPPYRRPALSRMVAEEVADSAFYFKPAAFYAEKGIELKLKCQISAVDRKNHLVISNSGEQFHYDRLILATGGSTFIPPLPGAECGIALRDHADLLEIRRKISEGEQQAVILGGGVLGLELADSLLKAGCQVTVLENGPALMKRNLGNECAGIITGKLRLQPGLDIRCGVKAVKMDRSGVYLENGDLVPAGMILFSTGMRSCCTLASLAGVEVNRGIVVNEFMQSSDPDIFACGDAAEFDGLVAGLLPAAKDMGSIAGKNAAGGTEKYRFVPYPVRLMALGMKIFAMGNPEGCRVEMCSGEEGFRRLVYDENDKLTGAMLCGDLKDAVRLQKELSI